MGFSTSSSVALLFVAFLIILSISLPTIFTLGSSAGEAYSSQAEQIRDYKNTEIEINGTAVDEGTNTTTVEAENTGSTTLHISRTYVLVDGAPANPETTNTTVVDGDEERNESVTDLWLPGTTLSIEIEADEPPERVTITTEGAVTASTGVASQTEGE